MRPFQARITYEAPVTVVAEMLADPAFVERKVAASNPVSSTIDVAGDTGSGFRVTTQRALPTDAFPPAVRNLIGPSIVLGLVETWGRAEPDGSRHGTVELDVVGKPASASGTARLSPGPGGSSVVVYEGAVEARIPLVGRKIEEQAVQQVQAVLEVERAAGVAWLAGR